MGKRHSGWSNVEIFFLSLVMFIKSLVWQFLLQPVMNISSNDDISVSRGGISEHTERKKVNIFLCLFELQSMLCNFHCSVQSSLEYLPYACCPDLQTGNISHFDQWQTLAWRAWQNCSLLRKILEGITLQYGRYLLVFRIFPSDRYTQYWHHPTWWKTLVRLFGIITFTHFTH